MAEEELSKILQEEMTCSICLDTFRHPVTLTCGHSFCSLCLLSNWRELDQPCLCPLCRRSFQMRDLKINHHLEKLAGIDRQIQSGLLQMKEESSNICKKHNSEEIFFCEEDQTLLCRSCFQTPEHSRHTVYSTGKAANHSRDKLQKCLTTCWQEMDTVHFLLNEEREKEKTCKDMAHAQRESLTAQYRRIHELLQEEEQLHLQLLADQEIEKLNCIRKKGSRFYRHLQSLRKVIINIEENYHKPNQELLQVAGELLNRCESLLGHSPKTVTSPKVYYQDTMTFEMLQYFKVNVTLNPENASPHLIVSDDLRTVVHEGCPNSGPFSSARLEKNFILGSPTFLFGIHYWEVDVGDSRQWSVGVCKNSLSRDEHVIAEESVFLLSCVENAGQYTVMTVPPYFRHQVHSPIPKIGILLDCNDGTISFYDALQKCFIYRFPQDSVYGLLRPLFSPCPPRQEESGIPMTLKSF